MPIIDARIRKFSEALVDAGWVEEVAAAFNYINHAASLYDEASLNFEQPKLQLEIFTEYTLAQVLRKTEMFKSMHDMRINISAQQAERSPPRRRNNIAFLDDNQNPLPIPPLEALIALADYADLLRGAFVELAESISTEPELIESMDSIPGDLFTDGPQRGFTR